MSHAAMPRWLAQQPKHACLLPVQFESCTGTSMVILLPGGWVLITRCACVRLHRVAKLDTHTVGSTACGTRRRRCHGAGGAIAHADVVTHDHIGLRARLCTCVEPASWQGLPQNRRVGGGARPSWPRTKFGFGGSQRRRLPYSWHRAQRQGCTRVWCTRNRT